MGNPVEVSIQDWHDLLNENCVRRAYATVWYGNSHPTMRAGIMAYAYLQKIRGGQFSICGQSLELDTELGDEDVVLCSTVDGFVKRETHSITIRIPDQF